MALHIGDLMGLPGTQGTWSGGVAQAQDEITDLSAHVDGGQATATVGTNAGTDTTVLHWAVGIVVAAGLLLWFLGGIVFKSVRL